MHRHLIWAAFGTFALGTEAFVIAGVLEELSRDLAVTPSQAGHLVTAYALTYAVGAPVLATLMAPRDRYKVMRVSMAAFVIGNLAAALAPSFLALLAARVAMALCAAAYSPAASAWAGGAVTATHRGRALAFVGAGIAVSTVVGVPVATQAGRLFGWRATFVLVALIALVAWIGLLRPRPVQAPAAVATIGQRIAWLRTPAVAYALVVTWLTYMGCYCVYTYLAPLAQAIAGPLLIRHLPMVLAAFGAAAVIGTLTGGHLADRFGARWVIPRALLLVGIAYAGLGALATGTASVTPAAAGAVMLLVLWGLVGWQLPAAQQLNLIQIAPQAAPIVLSLQGSALYVGVSTGALAGSLVLASGPPALLGWIGAACEFAALAIWLLRRPEAGALPAGLR